MQQYYIEQELNEEVEIVNNRFHYLKNVVKVKNEDEIILFNGIKKAIYKISNISNKSIELELVNFIEIKEKYSNVDLAIGLLKKNNTELVLQKACELGVNDIKLLKLENNVVKIEENNVEKKLSRFKDILISASEQSKRDKIPKVEYFKSIKDLNYENYDEVFVFHEKADYSKSLIKALDKKEMKNILLIIGPEGGISPKEIEYLETKGSVLSLGKNILRAETAAILAVGLCTNILSEEV